jgi:hypothetical protein
MGGRDGRPFSFLGWDGKFVFTRMTRMTRKGQMVSRASKPATTVDASDPFVNCNYYGVRA